MNRYNRQNPWILVIGIIVILAMLFTIISKVKQNDIEVYDDSQKIETRQEESTDNVQDIETFVYTDAKYKFSISIPSEWEQLTQDGYTTFIHAPSASSIQIQILDYDANINNINADSASLSVVDDDKTFVNFTKLSNSHYELLYQDYKNSTYDYIEDVHWDRDTIIKLVCIFNDENYDKILPYYTEILTSFAWEKNTPIPEGYYMYYDDVAQFEIAVPDAWTFGSTSGSAVMTDPESGATISVYTVEDDSSLESLSAVDMTNIVKNGKSNFMTKSFSHNADHANMTSTYTVDNTMLINRYHIYATGKYMYHVSIDYQSESIEESVYQTCLDLFRSFAAPDVTEEQATDGANEVSNEDVTTGQLDQGSTIESTLEQANAYD